MRKTVSLILVLAFALVMLTGCGMMAIPINFVLGLAFPGGYESSSPSYEGEAKSFYYSGLEIVLTDAFSADTEYTDAVYYEADDGTTVVVERFGYGAEGFESGRSDEEYAQSLRRTVCELYGEEGGALGFECSEVVLSSGIASFEYTIEFIYSVDTLVFVYPEEDAIFAVSFTLPVDGGEVYRAHVLQWASSVTYKNVNTAA